MTAWRTLCIFANKLKDAWRCIASAVLGTVEIAAMRSFIKCLYTMRFIINAHRARNRFPFSRKLFHFNNFHSAFYDFSSCIPNGPNFRWAREQQASDEQSASLHARTLTRNNNSCFRCIITFISPMMWCLRVFKIQLNGNIIIISMRLC